MSAVHFLLVVARNYWGSTVSEASGRAFGARLAALLDLREAEYLVGEAATPAAVRAALGAYASRSLAAAGEAAAAVLHVYMSGHGTQVPDADGDDGDGLDEAYQLPEGLVTDDDLTAALQEAVAAARPARRPLVVLVSDHCRSGSMLDGAPGAAFDWLAFGSSLDGEDSYASGDGHVMTAALLQVLAEDGAAGLTAAELHARLRRAMAASPIGELQHPTLHASGPEAAQALRPFSARPW
jgi:hypothetical protein